MNPIGLQYTYVTMIGERERERERENDIISGGQGRRVIN